MIQARQAFFVIACVRSLSVDAVADGERRGCQVTHDAKTSDTTSGIPAQIDEQATDSSQSPAEEMRNMIREVNADPAREESYLENADVTDHGSNGALRLRIRIVLVLGPFGGEVELAFEANSIPVDRDRGLCVHGKGRGSRRIELSSIDTKQDVATPDLSSLGDPARKHVLKNPPVAGVASLYAP